MSDEIEQLKKQKDQAYWERNQLVAALSKLFPAYLKKHPEDDKEWEEDWRTIVYVLLPIGATSVDPEKPGARTILTEMKTGQEYLQVSWHIHDSDISMFDHLGYDAYKYGFSWDGHSTEEKYRRLRSLKPRH